MKKLKNSTRPIATLLLIAFLYSSSFTAYAAEPHVHTEVYAPMGIMGDHIMHEDEWMFSYRFMRMDMDGNRSGTKRVATPLPGFMVSPLKMTMDMHMVGAMFGINDNVTLMTMLPFIKTDMNHVINMNGKVFNTKASGVGDLKISALWQLTNDGPVFNTGLSIPTGSIDEKDTIPVSAGVPVQLPYPMQTGSGSYDLLIGVLQSGHIEKLTGALKLM